MASVKERNKTGDIALIVVILLVLAGTAWYYYDRQKNQQSTIADKQQERAAQPYIGGKIIQVDPTRTSFLLASDNLVGIKRVTIVLDARTDIFRWSHDDVPKKIQMSSNDLAEGQFVTVVSEQPIGDSHRIHATQILILL